MKHKINILVPVEITTSPEVDYRATASHILPLDTQPDLLYIKSVLVSTGANKNDDVFLPEEMWSAKSSPILKPVNWEHNTGRELTLEESETRPNEIVVGNQIIGVMYNTYVTDENGVIISEEKSKASDFEIPKSFHIVDESVIYKGLYPKAAARIESGAKESKLFVSMEAWFSDYDYLVGTKVVARNEETAFLEDTLKANGGNGTFGNDKVKRILRNIVFGGKGIVARPANEPSIIQSVTHEPTSAKINSAIAKNIIGNIEGKKKESYIMSEQKTDKQVVASGPSFDDYKVVTQELAEVRTENKTLAGQLETTKAEATSLKSDREALKSAISKGGALLEEVLPGLNEKLSKADVAELFDVIADTVKTSKGQLAKEVEEAKAAKDEAEKELASLKSEVRMSKRLSQIASELNLTVSSDDEGVVVKAKKDQVASIAKQTRDLDDEAFASRLGELKSLLSISAKKDDMFKKKEDKKKDEDEEKAKKAKSDENSDEGITDASLLDAIKANASKLPAGKDSSNDGVLNLNKAYAGLVESLISSRKSTK
jgi:hypothetical protein